MLICMFVGITEPLYQYLLKTTSTFLIILNYCGFSMPMSKAENIIWVKKDNSYRLR